MKSTISVIFVLLIIQLKANRLLQQTLPAGCATIRCAAGYTCCDDGSGGATCCKDAVICAADVESCCDGTTVSRDPDNNCQFPECSTCLDPKDTCLSRVNCLVDPCDADINNRGDCGENEECTSNYCGGCNAVCTECGDNECLDPLGECAESVLCAKDPCDVAISPCKDGQTCTANYCGGCNAVCKDPVFCTKDAKICPDGTVVGRDGNNGCQYFPCPGDWCGKQGVNCGGIRAPAFTCSDGTCYGNCGTCSYQRDEFGNLVCSPELIAKEDVCPCKGLENCASYTPDGCNTCGCPEDGSLSFCTLSSCPPELITTKPECKKCRDGYTLENGICVEGTCCDPANGPPNNPICREGCACCPDGTWSGSIGDGKTFTCSGQTCIGQEACGGTVCEPVGCTEDAKVCPDGTVLSRDPNNDCEFPECPLCEVWPCLVPPCPCSTCSGSNPCINTLGKCDVIVNCLVDPCQFNNGGCKPGQTCNADYCGGCNAVCTDDTQTTLPPGCATLLCPVGSTCCDDGSGGVACCSDPLPQCCDMEDFPGLCFEGVQCCPDGQWSCSIGNGISYPCSSGTLILGQDTFGTVCPVEPGDKIECKKHRDCDRMNRYRCKKDKSCRKRWAAKGKCVEQKVCLREGGSCQEDTDCYPGYSCVGKKKGTGTCVDYQ